MKEMLMGTRPTVDHKGIAQQGVDEARAVRFLRRR
jgi:hypothetical protein